VGRASAADSLPRLWEEVQAVDLHSPHPASYQIRYRLREHAWRLEQGL
jgi:hypothetical protein